MKSLILKTTAVENFLGTLGDQTEAEAFANLVLDARLYRWNVATVEAIQQGLEQHFEALDARIEAQEGAAL